MQEPGQLKEEAMPQIAKMFPEGIVIKQEEEAPYRVQVRIPQYHTGIPDEDLPYYRVGFPPTVSGHNGRGGHFSTLTPGTPVVCIIYDPRGYNGIVWMVLPNKSNDIKGDDLHGWRDDKGNSFRVSKDGTMQLTGASGASFTLLADGRGFAKLTELTIEVNGLILTGETLNALFTQLTQSAQNWTVNAATPVINESGSSGHGPILHPENLPIEPDVANKTDM